MDYIIPWVNGEYLQIEKVAHGVLVTKINIKKIRVAEPVFFPRELYTYQPWTLT